MVSGTTLTWPANQTYSLENAQTVPMYSKKTITGTGEQSFSFSSLGAMLQIVFNTAQANVILKSIEVKDGSKTMSGAFHVDENGMAIIDASNKAGITLDLGTGVALGKGANYFNIAVPAGTYSNFSIIFTAIDNSTCTFTGGNVILNHNTVGRLTLTGFTPAVGYAKANGLGYVKWVQLWKNGPKFAEFNVGATSETGYGEYFAYAGNGQTTWGSNWRIPTQSDLVALLANCDVESTSISGVNGRKFTGRGGYASNSIFLPAAGYKDGSGLKERGNFGFYRTSTPVANSNEVYYMDFRNLKNIVTSPWLADQYSVRAVLNE